MADNFPNVSYLGSTGTEVGPWIMSGTEFRTMWQYGNYMFARVWESPTWAGQILVQKSPPSGGWTLEAQLPSAVTAAVSMTAVNFPHISGSPWKLVAGCWASGYAVVYARDDASETWQPIVLWEDSSGTANCEVRALIPYTDPTGGPGGTPIDYLFATSDPADSATGNGGIYRATYSATTPGNLVWGATPELALSATNTSTQYATAWNGSGEGVTPPSGLEIRGMSLDVLGDGNPYATIGCHIWKRTNGSLPSWSLVWTMPVPNRASSQSGLHGLTSFGQTSNYCLAAFEDYPFAIYKLNITEWAAPKYGAPVVKYTMADLQTALGTWWTVSYAIGAYNNMNWVEVSSTWYLLIGLSIQVTQWPVGAIVYDLQKQLSGQNWTWVGTAQYLIRNASTGAYKLQEMSPRGAWPMVACQIFYTHGSYVIAGGFDRQQGTAPGQSAWSVWDTAANAVA
jgi:hypothetical protein